VQYSAILLAGGNAAGKTTVLRQAGERLVQAGLIKPEWVITADEDTLLQKPLVTTFRNMMTRWADPRARVLLIEGTRIYSAVFRCLVHQSTFGMYRGLRAALMLQTVEVGARHIEARCVRRGKAYRKEFWESGSRNAEQLFASRYTRAFAKFQRDHPAAPLHEVAEFWITPGYPEHAVIHAWIDRAIRSS